MKHESPSENKLHLTFDIRRFETTSFFKQNIRTLDDFKSCLFLLLLVKFKSSAIFKYIHNTITGKQASIHF